MANKNPKRKKIWFQTSFPAELDPSFAMPQSSLPNTPKDPSSEPEQLSKQSNKCESSTPNTSRKRKPLPPAILPERVHSITHRDSNMVAITARGRLVGEDNPSAKYTDHDIDCVFALREQGWTVRQIGQKLDMPHSTVHAVLQGKLRAVTPVAWKKRNH